MFLNKKLQLYLIMARLFFILTPDVLLSLPYDKPKDKMEVMMNAALHAVVFVVAMYLVMTTQYKGM